MHHARAGLKVDDSFRALPHPSRLSGGAFCTGLGLCRDDFQPDARTSWGACSFGMNRAGLLRPPRWGLRPFVVGSSPPAAAEVQTPHRPEPPAPSRAQNREQHTCMRGARGQCMHASHPHRLAPPLQPQMPLAPAFPCLLRRTGKRPSTPHRLMCRARRPLVGRP